MKNVKLEYRTTAQPADLGGARPGIDWKGDKNLELLLSNIQQINIDWQADAEKALKDNTHLSFLPFGTRVTKLFYNFQYTTPKEAKKVADVDHCDMPDMLARKLADFDGKEEAILGMWISRYATVVHPDGEEETFELGRIPNDYIKLLNYYKNGELVSREPQKKETQKSKPRGKRYPGSENIAKLVNKAIQNQAWHDPHSLPLQNPDWPLRPNELSTLYNLAVGDTTLDIYLGHRGKPPVNHYMTLDAKEFPKKLIAQLLSDDHDGNLDDIASMKIQADVKIDGESVLMNIIHKLPSEDEDTWYPKRWNILVVTIDWQADSHCGSASKVFARQYTDAINRHAVIMSGRPLFISSNEMKEAGSHLFPDIEVLSYLNDGVTIRYGNSQYDVKLDKPFLSDKKSENHTTFQMSIKVELE